MRLESNLPISIHLQTLIQPSNLAPVPLIHGLVLVLSTQGPGIGTLDYRPLFQLWTLKQYVISPSLWSRTDLACQGPVQ